MISTVDAFQGGERDIIILSCVRTKHAGFIDSDRCVCVIMTPYMCTLLCHHYYRRVNVALTRAKRYKASIMLYIIQ